MKHFYYNIILFWFLANNVKVYLEGASFTSDTYGPYNFRLSIQEICRIPKRNEIAIASCRLDDKDNLVLYTNMTVLRKVTLQSVKIVIYGQNSRKNAIWSNTFTKPCERFALGPLLSASFNTSKDCIVKKRIYILTNHLEVLVRGLLGPFFFYGDFYVKYVLIAKEGTFFCVIASFTFTKSV